MDVLENITIVPRVSESLLFTFSEVEDSLSFMNSILNFILANPGFPHLLQEGVLV